MIFFPNYTTLFQLFRPPKNLNAPEHSVLNQIEHVIAVSSCKGGVGKSTLSVNLALNLAQRGLRVGILDADIYGPSLPHLLRHKELNILKSSNDPKFIVPLESSYGLRTMSFGFVNPKAGVPGAGGRDAAIMRGPIASRVINQLLNATDWGPLDYLIVDMPPGTGDIQITLSQSAFFTGAVVVTTPHPLSITDVAKGVAMFEQVKVPVLSIVENMSHFTCKLGNTYYPFGKAGKTKIEEAIMHKKTTMGKVDGVDIPFTSIPMIMYEEHEKESVEEASDATSFHTTAEYQEVTNKLLDQIFREIVNAKLLPSIQFNESSGSIHLRYYTPTSAEEYIIPLKDLYSRDPKSGNIRNVQTNADELLSPSVDIRGNYGIAITWNDGINSDIYPFHILRGIALDLRNSSDSSQDL